MLSRCALALAAALGLSASSAWTQSDVFQLRLDQSAALELAGASLDDDADLFDVGYKGYGGYRGFKGYGGGYHGFKGYYGGYRGHYAHYGNYGHYGYRSYYRPYYNFSFAFGRPFYGYSSYYYPRYSYAYNYYRPYYYSGYSSYYNGGDYSSYYCPISVKTGGFSLQLGTYPQGSLNYEPAPNYLPQPRTIQTMPPADAPPSRAPEGYTPDNRTYPYDGGPSYPVPMPTPMPTLEPSNLRPTVPLEGRPVSLPATTKSTKFAYPAYGEDKLPPTKFGEDRTTPLQTPGVTARK